MGRQMVPGTSKTSSLSFRPQGEILDPSHSFRMIMRSWLLRNSLSLPIRGDEVFADGSPLGSRGEFLYTGDTGRQIKSKESSNASPEWRNAIGEMVRDHTRSPELEHYFSVKVNKPRAQLMITQLGLFIRHPGAKCRISLRTPRRTKNTAICF
jgi:hypothetical protein